MNIIEFLRKLLDRIFGKHSVPDIPIPPPPPAQKGFDLLRLNLPDDYSVAEKWIIKAAFDLKPWGETELRIVELSKKKTLGGIRLDILLHALADKESGFRADIVAAEANGILAYGAYQFHKTTAEPFLKKLGYTWEQFLISIDVQTETVIALLESDYKRTKSVKGAFRQFGPGTKRVMYPIVNFLEANKDF